MLKLKKYENNNKFNVFEIETKEGKIWWKQPGKQMVWEADNLI